MKKQQLLQPYSEDAERAVLGSAMCDGQIIESLLDILPNRDCFYHSGHGHIYDAAKSLHQRGVAVDFVTVAEELTRARSLADAGGAHYLAQILRATPSLANAEHHARIVYERWIKRRMIREATSILESCYDPSTDAFEELDRSQQRLYEISSRKPGRTYKTSREVAAEALAYLHRAYDSKGMIGTPTGLIKLDEITGGVHDSDLVIIAGRPGMGKSGLALSIVRNFLRYRMLCNISRPNVAYFTMEMSALQNLLRDLAGDIGIDSSKLRSGRFIREDLDVIARSLAELSNRGVFFDERPALDIGELKRSARMMVRELDIGLIVVDYIQLMHADTAEKTEERRISRITKGLKEIAKELNVPVIALSQLNRGVEGRDDKRPVLSDLRGGGSIEEDADTVWFLYRPAYYDEESDNYGDTRYFVQRDGQLVRAGDRTELNVAKQRSGETKTVFLLFENRFARFSNVEDIGFGQPEALPAGKSF